MVSSWAFVRAGKSRRWLAAFLRNSWGLSDQRVYRTDSFPGRRCRYQRLVLDAATGDPMTEVRVTVRMTKSGRLDLEYPATTEAATNKLFRAARFKLPEPGRWQLQVEVGGLDGPAVIGGEVDAAEPLPALAGDVAVDMLARRGGRGIHYSSSVVTQPSETKMIVTNYTPEDLKKLPLRAIVALSARCARRVEHLAVPEDDDPETQRCRAAVSNAIRLTENSRAARRVRPQNPSSPRSNRVGRSQMPISCGIAALATIETAARAATNALHVLDLRNEAEASRRPGCAKADPLLNLADVTADLTAQSCLHRGF